MLKKDDLLLCLLEKNIQFDLHEHPAVFTAQDAMVHCAHLRGAHVKNLFLRDPKKRNYILVTLRENKQIDLSKLSVLLELGKLSFASAEDLNRLLGVQPGSVTPAAVLNDRQHCVKLFFDNDLLKEEYINIHPMINTATITLKLHDLLFFIEKNHDKKINFISIPGK